MQQPIQPGYWSFSGPQINTIGASPEEVADIALAARKVGFKEGVESIPKSINPAPGDPAELFRRLDKSYPDGFGIYWAGLTPVATAVKEAFKQGAELNLTNIRAVPSDSRSGWHIEFGYVGAPGRGMTMENIRVPLLVEPGVPREAMGFQDGFYDYVILFETLALTTDGASFVVGLKRTPLTKENSLLLKRKALPKGPNP